MNKSSIRVDRHLLEAARDACGQQNVAPKMLRLISQQFIVANSRCLAV